MITCVTNAPQEHANNETQNTTVGTAERSEAEKAVNSRTQDEVKIGVSVESDKKYGVGKAEKIEILGRVVENSGE